MAPLLTPLSRSARARVSTVTVPTGTVARLAVSASSVASARVAVARCLHPLCLGAVDLRADPGDLVAAREVGRRQRTARASGPWLQMQTCPEAAGVWPLRRHATLSPRLIVDDPRAGYLRTVASWTHRATSGLVLCLACTTGKPGVAGSVPESPALTGPTLTLYGLVGNVQDNLGIPDVAVAAGPYWSQSDASGHWQLEIPDAPWASLVFSAAGFLSVDAWIRPEEAADPMLGYASRQPTVSDRDAALNTVGVAPIEGRTVLFVDALDPSMGCIADAVVTVSSAHGGSFRERTPGEWVAENLSNPDNRDLMFVNVTPGPVTVSVVAPDGASREVAPGLVLRAEAVAMVSAYCDYVEPG